MATIQDIRNENQEFLESLKENKGKLYSLLRTMSRFHRYNVQAQLSIAIHAPSYASAYATEELWSRMGRTVPEGAKGIEIDTNGDEPVVIYDVNNTVGPQQSLIWRFDKRTDEVLFDGLEPVNGTVPDKVAELCRTGAQTEADTRKEATAAFATAIILNRLGYNYRNVVDIGSIDLDTENLAVALANANALSREVLDNVAEYMRKGKDEEHVRAANSHFRALERTQAEVSGRNGTHDAASNEGQRDSGGLPDERGGRVQPGISEDSGRSEGEVERAGVRATGNESNGMAGTDERSEDVSQRDDSADSVQPVEEAEEIASEPSFEQMRDIALEKAAFLNSDIMNQRIVSLCELANNPESPFQAEAQRNLRLAYVADEGEIRLAYENFIDVLRDHVLERVRELNDIERYAVVVPSHTNERISSIFQRSKNEKNTDDIAQVEDLLTLTQDELLEFRNNYLDYLIFEGVRDGQDIAQRRLELYRADRSDGLSLSSPIVEYFRLRRPNDELAQEIPSDLTFEGLYREMQGGRDFEAITGVGDSLIRQVVFREYEILSNNLMPTADSLYEMDRENYFNRSAEENVAQAETVQVAEEERTRQDMESFTEALSEQDGSVGNMDDEDSLGDVPEEEQEATDALRETFTAGLPEQDGSVGDMDDEDSLGDIPEEEQEATNTAPAVAEAHVARLPEGFARELERLNLTKYTVEVHQDTQKNYPPFEMARIPVQFAKSERLKAEFCVSYEEGKGYRAEGDFSKQFGDYHGQGGYPFFGRAQAFDSLEDAIFDRSNRVVQSIPEFEEAFTRLGLYKSSTAEKEAQEVAGSRTEETRSIVSDSDRLSAIDRDEAEWRESWVAYARPDFSNRPDAEEEYAFLGQLTILDTNYRHIREGRNVEECFANLSNYVSEEHFPDFSEESLNALKEYQRKLLEFASRRLELERGASVEAVPASQENTTAGSSVPDSTQEEVRESPGIDTIASIDAEESAWLESWQDPPFEGLTGSTPSVATYFNYKGLLLRNYQDYKNGSISDLRPYIESTKRHARYLENNLGSPEASAALMQFTEKLEEFYNRRQELSVTRYKYYLDRRPADLGSVPKNFESIDANDEGGRYGAIYYTRPLTATEVREYELTTELDKEESDWRDSWDDPEFPNTPEGDRQHREYRHKLHLLNQSYKAVSAGRIPMSLLDSTIGRVIHPADFADQKVTDALIEYSNKLVELASRRLEAEKAASPENVENAQASAEPEPVNAETVENTQAGNVTDTSTETVTETETIAATEAAVAEPLSPERAAEIQAALDSTANANTKEAFRKNLLAIQVMKELETSGRTPTEEEIALMRSYVGFGGLREQLFQEGYKGWENEQQQLKDVLTEAEYDAVRASTLTAFYTPPEIIEAIYKSLENIGFEKGNILDPSMGSGRFFQNMPENMRNESNLFGVELDPLTGRMAKFAYPEAEISINGFEKTTYPNNSFDLAISNIPFGDFSVYDTSEKGTFKIHDYFIAKMIEQVRPGGIVAVVTSAGTMDKADETARKYFATKAELMDAVRLPVGAFKSAGTQVGTDILLFKKRQRELSLEDISNDYWVESRDKETNFSSFQDHMMVNAYFNNNPQQVLGKMKPVSTQFGFAMSCVPDDNPQPIGDRIVEAFSNIRSRYAASEEEMPRPVQLVAKDGVTFSFYIDEKDNLMFSTPTGDSQPKLTKSQEAKIRAILPLRNQVRALIDMEKDSSVTDAMVKEELESLNRAYDSYYEKFGSIALDKDLKKAFHDDISYPLMCSIEKISFDVDRGNVYEGKGDIFSSRIIVPHVEPDHADSALDALSISILERGKVDLSYMESLTGQSQRELLKQLENIHIYYDDEQGEYVHVDEYLSGDIRGKIEYIDGSIETLQDELQKYASEKILPDSTARFAPRNETEEIIVNNPYKYIRITDSNREFAEKANAEAREYIESHLDDKAFAAVALSYLYHDGNSLPNQELSKAILDRYGNDLSFVADARREGYSAIRFSGEPNDRGFELYEALDRAIESPTWNKHYDPKYTYNFIKEKIQEYQGREDDLLKLRGRELNGEFEAWIKAKDTEIESFAENNLSDKRIKNLQDRITVLEQKKADLEEVKPVDVKADEINVGLGTTWLPPKYIETFMKEVFDMGWQAGDTCKCFYESTTGTWQITNKTQVYSALVEHTYGYSDKLNGLHLLEQALNFKTPTVYILDENDNRVPDAKATQIAQQKQDIIKDEFKKWLFKDKERTQAIEDYYNRHFNSLVPRKFNGEALTFPGMNPNINLRDHQKNAIAHTLYGGNALFAHAVGAGKTFEMVASAMESKRLGLANKSMIVVPNHLTEQFGAEFKQLYPDANVLVATANDFKKDKRKEFCAKIATYNWDAVVIGTTQFERIPMSPEYMEHSMTQQINELVTAMEKIRQSSADGANKRFSIRNIETMKKKIEARLEKLRNSPKDSVVRFEDLGIDRLYVDEAHEFKNLFTYTKMSNVAGVSTTDAQKTTDLYEKVRYLNNKTGEKGVIFATGTPVSNSMTELYTMMRYLEPSKLKNMGIDSFDAWASTFGETTTGYELRPEGKGFQRKTRFAKFNNMPELMSLFQEVADIKTQDMLNLDVPEAEYIVEKLEPSQEQKVLLDTLVERAEAIHKGCPMQVKTKDGAETDDNFLWITTEGKKLALDQRLLNPMLPDDPNSKVNKCVENVLNEYKETTPIKGAQLIFCDMSTPTNDGSFNVYDDIKAKLIEGGVKESEVAFIHDAKDEDAKAKLFAKVRSGDVRVLLGSTKKMGTGTNVQDLLVASHDLDVPWRPADLEQRAGRTIRQGNKNKEVKIYRYVTEGTFDAYLWQTIENKQRFISQVMTSKSPLRTIEDCDETTLSYAEIKAVSIGNPLIKEKLDNDNEISRLMLSKSEFIESRKAIQQDVDKYLPAAIKSYEELYDKVQADVAHVAQNANVVDGQEIFKIKLNDKTFTDRKEAGEYLEKCMKDGSYQKLKGEYKGMNLSMAIGRDMSTLGTYQLMASHRDTYCIGMGNDPVGNMKRLEHRMQTLPESMEKVKQNLDDKKHSLEVARKEVNRTWPMEDKLAACLKRAKELDALLLEDSKDTPENVKEAAGEKKSKSVACR